jgi:hypothetical protein
MERGRLLSIKRKISHGMLKDVLEEILTIDGPVPEEIISSIREFLEAGNILDSRSLGKIVIRTRDREIFQAVRTHAMMSTEMMCEFLRAGIPDKQIEESLCKNLAWDFDHNNYGSRQLMLEALRDCGTVTSLDILEAIEYDFSARLKVAEVVVTASPNIQPSLLQEYAQSISMKTDIFLGNLLKETIKAIGDRNEVGDDLWGALAERGDPFARSVKYQEKATYHLEHGDLGAALNYLRKATESMLKTVIQLQKIRPDKDMPIEKMELPMLMAILMDKRHGRNPDKSYYKFLEQLRDSSTLGSHDQGEQTESLFEPEMVQGQIKTFENTLKYFRSYVE